MGWKLRPVPAIDNAGQGTFPTYLNYPIIKLSFCIACSILAKKHSAESRLHLWQSSRKDAGISRGEAIVDTHPNCKMLKQTDFNRIQITKCR